MHRVRGLRAIIAAFLALPFGVMDVRGQQEGLSLELRELRPEWAELIISTPPGTNVAIEISEDAHELEKSLERGHDPRKPLGV